MLAEIYMLRLEAAARAAKEMATSSRFVPITLPVITRGGGGTKTHTRLK